MSNTLDRLSIELGAVQGTGKKLQPENKCVKNEDLQNAH